MSWEAPKVESFYRESDNIEALKKRFVELCALRNINLDLNANESAMTPYFVGEYVFEEAGCIDFRPRGGQIGQMWAKEFAIRERIALVIAKGKEVEDANTENDLYLRALRIVDDTTEATKNRLKALEIASKIKGVFKSDQEAGAAAGGTTNANELLTAIASKLPN